MADEVSFSYGFPRPVIAFQLARLLPSLVQTSVEPRYRISYAAKKTNNGFYKTPISESDDGSGVTVASPVTTP